jgi:hypothetical protein
MSRDGRDPAVDRLPDLSDHHEVVDRALAQGAEPLLPGGRQRPVQGAEIARNFLPRTRVTAGVIRLVYVSHVFVLGFANKRTMLMFKTMIFDD